LCNSNDAGYAEFSTHTTNLRAERRRGLRVLVDISLALDFLAADPMRLIPV